MIYAHTTAQLNRVQEELRKKYVQRVEPSANVRTVLELGADTYIWYRKQMYRFQPTPYREGLRLFEIRQKIAAFKGDATEYGPLLDEVVQVANRLARPVRRRKENLRFLREKLLQLLGRWRPFDSACESEIGGLLDFLLILRTKSRVRPV